MSSFHPASPLWTPVSDSDSLKRRLGEGTWRREHDPDVVLQGMTLPFYADYRLIVATCPHWRPESTALFWLAGSDHIYRLNGVSPPIHEANAQSNQRITEDTALAYVTFFNFFVRGEEGPFAIIGSFDDPYLPAGLRGLRSPDEESSRARRLLALRHQSPRYYGKDADGRFRYSATVLYSNAIFVADLLVHPGGMVEMKGDTPLIADLPFKVDAPLTLAREFQP